MSGVERLAPGTPLTWPKVSGVEPCRAMSDEPPVPWSCTGPAGHTGPHVAEGSRESYARWEDE